DQFIAAVEILRRPELAERPVVVGGRDGDPTRRGVVATANYVAREYGVRSGMPLRTALKRCPEAVFLPADNPAYEAASERVMAVLRGFPGVVVEVMGWDEAFVGAPVADAAAAEELAQRIQAAVVAETRLTCAVGIGDNLLRAKIATEFGKPGAVGHRREDRREARRTRDRHRDPARRGRPGGARRRARAHPGPLVRAAGARDRPGRGARRAVGRALARAGGDLPGRPHRLGGRARSRRDARPPRRRGRAGRRQARRARGRQGPVRP